MLYRAVHDLVTRDPVKQQTYLVLILTSILIDVLKFLIFNQWNTVVYRRGEYVLVLVRVDYVPGLSYRTYHRILPVRVRVRVRGLKPN